MDPIREEPEKPPVEIWVRIARHNRCNTDAVVWGVRATIKKPDNKYEGQKPPARFISFAEHERLQLETLKKVFAHYHGCLTGDCPHEKQEDCDEAVKVFEKELREIAK